MLAYKITTAWKDTADGQMFEAMATAQDSSRVIARASCHFTFDTQHDMRIHYDASMVNAIEQSVIATCDQLAKDFPER